MKTLIDEYVADVVAVRRVRNFADGTPRYRLILTKPGREGVTVTYTVNNQWAFGDVEAFRDKRVTVYVNEHGRVLRMEHVADSNSPGLYHVTGSNGGIPVNLYIRAEGAEDAHRQAVAMFDPDGVRDTLFFVEREQ